jgi:hypothetical protein
MLGGRPGPGAGIQKGENMDQKLLCIYLQAQALISEREGMIAENKHREYVSQSIVYAEDAFLLNANKFRELIEYLRK